MNKSDLITWLASLSDDSPDLARVAAIRKGEGTATPAEPLFTLAEVGRAVRLHPSWLWRLGVPAVCGEQRAGRLRYRLSGVEHFLRSSECRQRIAELHARRKAREKKGVAA